MKQQLLERLDYLSDLARKPGEFTNTHLLDEEMDRIREQLHRMHRREAFDRWCNEDTTTECKCKID